jgi:hypothetical protein
MCGKTVEAFWNIFGIGPWYLFLFGSPAVADLRIYGSKGYARSFGAATHCGPIKLDLLRDVDGKSAYSEWIEEAHPSIKHNITHLFTLLLSYRVY